MKRVHWTLVFSGLILTSGLMAGDRLPRVEERSFAARGSIRLELVSGDCLLRTGAAGKIEVRVESDFDPADFHPQFVERGEVVVLKEEFSGRAHGRSVWKVTVPASTVIDCESASGDVKAAGGTAGITVRTASGDVDLQDFSGGCRVQTASGDIDLARVKGGLEVKTASGDIHGERLDGPQTRLASASGDIALARAGGELRVSTASGDIEVTEGTFAAAAKFASASGDVSLKLAASPAADLNIATASGDVELDYAGHPMAGTFTLTTKKGGEIRAPFPFGAEEEFLKHGQTYVRKSAVRRGATPRIEIDTATGSIELRE